MKHFIKSTFLLLTVGLIVVLTIIPCFASRGDITTKNIKGEWFLKYDYVTDVRSVKPYSFVCTEEIFENMQTGWSKPPQVMADQAGEFGYAEIHIDLVDGATQWQAVAHYLYGIGTRAFDNIVLGYTYPNEKLSPVGQEMTLSCIYLTIHDFEDQSVKTVDYLMVMLDYDNVVWSSNLEKLVFPADYTPIYVDSGNIACQDQALKVFGTNAFGGAVLNTGAFVPMGTDPVPPASDTLQSFVTLAFDTLTNILSIEFFGWFSIGALVAVFISISAVLLFLKYFAGG